MMVPTLLANTIDRIFELAVRVSDMVAAMLISHSWLRKPEEQFLFRGGHSKIVDARRMPRFPGTKSRLCRPDRENDQFRCWERLKNLHQSHETQLKGHGLPQPLWRAT